MKFLLVDFANSFFRCKYIASKQSTTEEKVAFAIHLTLSSIAKCWKGHDSGHVIFALEGRSWRKDFYAPYKANRAVARAALTEEEQELDRLFFEAFTDLQTFVLNKTNCTVLQNGKLEADDLIAGWIQSHPNDHHTIVSSDTDYYQLIAENVVQYNGVTDELITLDGFFNHTKGTPVQDKKTKEDKKLPDPKWILFEKCMRGDPTDNVFSAYPGVRVKGSKKKVGLTEAYADKTNKGYNWNNMMLQRWTDHNGMEHRVLDAYNRNVTLIDLTAQPDDIKLEIAMTIADSQTPKNAPMIGAQFLKFCGKYNLVKLSEQATSFSNILSATYNSEDYK
jgi:5'-3' exonuclease